MIRLTLKRLPKRIQNANKQTKISQEKLKGFAVNLFKILKQSLSTKFMTGYGGET